jgi:hypothetical protein
MLPAMRELFGARKNMALYPEIRLTPDLEAELRRVIDALPDDELATLARTEPAFLSGGFRAGNVAALRVRCFQIAIGTQLISDALRRQIARHSLQHSVFGLLSAGTMVELRHELATLFGAPRLLLAMLVDERAEVRDTAARWLKQETPFLALAPDVAAARLRETFARLMEVCGASTHAGAVVTRESWQEAREQIEQQLRDARAELRRFKGLDDRLARHREQLTACERERDDARTRLTDAETQARVVSRERDAAKVELERELRHREERLRAALEVALANESLTWLASARKLSGEVVTSGETSNDLLARAAAALQNQAATDRHSGDRASVRTRLDALDRTLAQVRDAQANAMQPLPELVACEREMVAETQRLRRILGGDDTRTPMESSLSARFATAMPDDLPSLRSLVEKLSALGTLEGGASSRLMEQLQRRQQVVHATTSGAPAEMEPSENGPMGILKRALSGRGTAVLLVDGHNVLFGMQSRYLPPSGAAVPTAAARERLIADVVRLAGGRPTCRAWIVFDGPTRSEMTPAANVRVTYSGGEGEHRADAVITDTIRFFRTVGDTPVVLASNDNELCAEARRLGALTITALDFAKLL